MTEAELRSDIEAARQKMNVAMGGRREIRKLAEHLWPDERVEQMTTGYYAGGTGLIVLTDRRLIFTKDGWTSKTNEDFPLDKISSIGFQSGLLLGGITIYASGNKTEIANVNKQDGKRMVDHVRARLSQSPEPSASNGTTAAAPAADPIEQLRKLGELRDAGILTDEEFQAKKEQLLGQV